MFRRQRQGRRSIKIVFVIFRLILSIVMFAVLLGGVYSSYKHFSGLDPLKLDPGSVLSEALAGKIPKEFLGILSSNQVTKSLSDQINQKVLNQQKSKEIPSEDAKKAASPNLAFKFLLIADSHSDNVNLAKAINQAKLEFPGLKFIIGLGDYTDVGTISELQKAKKELDNSNLRYFLIPGDHDLWDCRNRDLLATACFSQVFGPAYQSFTFNEFFFMLLDNSNNYTGFDAEQLQWIADELGKSREVKGIFVFIHEPLFHPSSEHVMGWVEKKLKLQAEQLLFQLKDTGLTKKIFSGDIHYFSQYSEPKTGLSMITIGAITSERNPQAPRFGVVSVFDDGSTKVEDVEIK